jgi:hypothetical protein
VTYPSRIRILAVGKLRKGWVQEGMALDRQRLAGLVITELKRPGPPDTGPGRMRVLSRPDWARDSTMTRMRHKAEQIIRKITTAEQLIAQGKTVADVCRVIEVTPIRSFFVFPMAYLQRGVCL